MRLRTSPISDAAPFDVPCDDGFIGVRPEAGTLVTVLEIHPGPVRPLRLDRPWADTGDHDSLRLNSLAQWMIRPEAAATTVTVLTHGMACWGDGPSPRAYRALLGPLRVAAHRSVYVVVRFDSLTGRAAAARHGAGTTATLAAALSATRRIRNLLRGDGLAVGALTAAQITGVTARLAEGVDPATASLEGGGLRAGRLHSRTWAVDGSSAADVVHELESAWRTDVLSATWTLTLHPVVDGPPRVSALVRSTCHDDESVSAGPAPPTGGPRAAAIATLPRALPPRFTAAALRPDVAAELLATGGVPVAGAGQIVGADASGAPVAMRLAGPRLPSSTICGDHALAAQMVGRLAALGFTSVVHTDRPQSWTPLIDAVGDQRLLTFAGRVGADGVSQVIVDDRPDEPIRAEGAATVVRVRTHADDDDHPTIRQDWTDPGAATVRAAGVTAHVRLVAVAHHPAFDGRPGTTVTPA